MSKRRNKINQAFIRESLRLGENVQHRLCRQAWSSLQELDGFNAHQHRAGRYVEIKFFEKSQGFYREPRN